MSALSSTCGLGSESVDAQPQQSMLRNGTAAHAARVVRPRATRCHLRARALRTRSEVALANCDAKHACDLRPSSSAAAAPLRGTRTLRAGGGAVAAQCARKARRGVRALAVMQRAKVTARPRSATPAPRLAARRRDARAAVTSSARQRGSRCPPRSGARSTRAGRGSCVLQVPPHAPQCAAAREATPLPRPHAALPHSSGARAPSEW